MRPSNLPDYYFPQDELDPESFAFDILFGSAAEDVRPRKIGADAWFGFRNADRYEIHEQSVRVMNNDILTLLQFKA